MSAILRVLGWTPSRLVKYKQCPAKVKYEDLIKLCPSCFKGHVSGGYDGEPVKCDTCTKPQPEREALDRGTMLDAALTQAVAGKMPKKVEYKYGVVEADQPLAVALRHPKIEALARKLHKAKAPTQVNIVLDKDWKPVSQYTKGAWGRLKLDVLHLVGKVARVIDWKSGNIDKSKGEIKEKPEYYDSMFSYQVSVLAVNPKVSKVEAVMAFTDAPPRLDLPFKTLPVLTRAELPDAKKKWEDKVRPMLNDTIFAPRPGYYCGWCPFSKKAGGPCPH